MKNWTAIGSSIDVPPSDMRSRILAMKSKTRCLLWVKDGEELHLGVRVEAEESSSKQYRQVLRVIWAVRIIIPVVYAFMGMRG